MFGVSRSSSARSEMEAPSERSRVLLQNLNPLFFTVIFVGPGGISTVEGVLPMNLPLSSISALAGSEEMAIEAARRLVVGGGAVEAGTAGTAVSGAGLAAGAVAIDNLSR